MKWENKGRSWDVIDERHLGPAEKPEFSWHTIVDWFRPAHTDKRSIRQEDPGTNIVVIGDDPDTPGGIPPPSERKRWVSEVVDIPPEKSRLREALGATQKKWDDRKAAAEWFRRQEERERYPGDAGDIANALKPTKRQKKPKDL